VSSELCETYTHPTAGMAPNQHNEMQRAICGGVVQEEGLRESLDALIEMVAVIALYYTRLFQFEDVFEDLAQRFDRDQSARANATPAPAPE
jgi:hypothetical protein